MSYMENCTNWNADVRHDAIFCSSEDDDESSAYENYGIGNGRLAAEYDRNRIGIPGSSGFDSPTDVNHFNYFSPDLRSEDMFSLSEDDSREDLHRVYGKTEVQDDGDDEDRWSNKNIPHYYLKNVEESVCSEDYVVAAEDATLLLDDGRGIVESPICPSLFPNVPATIHFVVPNQRVSSLPEELGKLLKWHCTSTTPVVLKKILSNMGFKFTRRGQNWIGLWGKHMKPFQFRFLKSFQKVNHFPGTFQIGRKDRLWRNMLRLQIVHGRKHFNFIPTTFIMPQDVKFFRQAWEYGGAAQRWILKPPASARGSGIKIIHKSVQLPRKGNVIIQKYISRPYLINGTKFDLRIYVYVSSFNPLRIYMYEDGLVRFASVKYSNSAKYLGDRYMHLTNYSINKQSFNYKLNNDEKACRGHKWTLKALWSFLSARNIDVKELQNDLQDIVVKTIMSCKMSVDSLMRANVSSRYSCHELFGFDVLLDENLKPWLLEVNISPSLHSSTSLDFSVKSSMLKDLLNLAGFAIPRNLDNLSMDFLSEIMNEEDQGPLFLIDNWYSLKLSKETKAKHVKFKNCPREKYLPEILDHLTPDDVRCLVEAEDESNRTGSFLRVFPTFSSHRFHRYLEECNYYANLFDAWEHYYHCHREAGRDLLRELCRENFHLKEIETVSSSGSSSKRKCWHPTLLQKVRMHQKSKDRLHKLLWDLAKVPRNSKNGEKRPRKKLK